MKRALGVTVVIPAYNAGAFVAAAIRSVQFQTAVPDEIIVVDDGSTDDTPAVLAEFSGDITVLRQKNGGASAALNAGIAQVATDLIAFIDADDLWTFDKLEGQLPILRQNSGLDAVFGHMRQFRNANTEAPSETDFIDAEPQPGLVKGTMLIRRSAFDRFGAFDVARGHADFVDWFARAKHAGIKSQMEQRLVYLRRIHGANLGIRDRADQHKAYLAIMKDVLDRRRGV